MWQTDVVQSCFKVLLFGEFYHSEQELILTDKPTISKSVWVQAMRISEGWDFETLPHLRENSGVRCHLASGKLGHGLSRVGEWMDAWDEGGMLDHGLVTAQSSCARD